MTAVSELSKPNLKFPALLTLTVILCLGAIQVLGTNACIPLATAAAILVFCTRTPVYTTWDLLEHVYFLRTSTPKPEGSPFDWS